MLPSVIFVPFFSPHLHQLRHVHREHFCLFFEPNKLPLVYLAVLGIMYVTQHAPVHHPLETSYDLVMYELQLSHQALL